jgi:hypothetical protein
MKEQVKGILYDLRSAGWTVQKIEKELKFSNGSLGKVVLGKSGISEFRFDKLMEFHKKIIKNNHTVTAVLTKQISQNNEPSKKNEIEQKRQPYMSDAIKKKLGIK